MVFKQQYTIHSLGFASNSLMTALTIALACLLCSATRSAAQTQTLPSCPIMPDQPASAEHYADYNGLRYYFCCDGCVSDFRSDPSRFVNLSTVKGFPIASASEQITPLNSENPAAESPSSDTIATSSQPSLLSKTTTYYKKKLQKRIDKYCLDMPQVQLRLLAFFSILSIPLLPFYRRETRHKFACSIDRLEQNNNKAIRWLSHSINKIQLRWVAWIALVAVSFDSISMASRTSRTERQMLEILTGDKSLDAPRQAAFDNNELKLIKEVHYSTFADYGYPPRPKKRESDLSLTRTYYRGNDERNPQMFNGGRYLTVTFDLRLERQDGTVLDYNSEIKDQPVFLRVRFTRAPHTSSGYYTREYMKRMYLTMQSGRFLGRDQPVEDRLQWTEVEDGRIWEARFQLPEGDQFPASWKQQETSATAHQETIGKLHRGIVYLCEERMDESQNVLGGRFHFAVEYSLVEIEGRITQSSDLFMGTSYRGSNFTKYKITEEEWLSTAPLKEKPAP